MAVIQIPYRPRDWQLGIHDVESRFKVLVVPRGHGKSVLCVNEIIRAALTTPKPNLRFAYIAVSYKAAKRIVWDYFKHFLAPIPNVVFNESDLTIRLPNKAEILLLGADNADSLRGIHLNGVVLDEVALMPANLWHKVVRPMLSDKQGWATFIGTPDGQNLFYDLYEHAKVTPGWYSFKKSCWELNVIPKHELEAIKLSMTPEAFAQELECSFTAAARGTYYASLLEQALEENRITHVKHNTREKVYTSWDIGFNDSTAIWFFQVFGGKRYYIDYYENSREPLYHYVNVLNAKPYEYAEHILPHDVENHEFTSGQRRIDTLSSHGLTVRVAPKIAIADRIHATQMELAHCFFDREGCAQGLNALKEYKSEFDDRKGVFKQQPLHDWSSHAADAFGYGVIGLNKSATKKYNKYRDIEASADGPSIKYW